METKCKSLCFRSIVIALMLGYVVAITSQYYNNLKSQSNYTIYIVKKAKENLMGKLSITDPLLHPSKKNWHFGVSECWNTSLTEEERLSDDFRRLRILKQYAVALKISSKNYVRANIAMEISNLYRAINKVKTRLGYSRTIQKVPKIVVSHFNATTPREQLLIDVHFLATLQKNLLLIMHDFSQRTQPMA